MIALLNMAIMDKTAMIRTAPKMNMIIFSRLLLLLSKSTSPLCLDFEADMSISQEDELFYIPSLWCLDKWFHLNGIWLAFPAAETGTLLVALIMMAWYHRKKIITYSAKEEL